MALKTGDSQWSNDGPLVQVHVVHVAWGFCQYNYFCIRSDKIGVIGILSSWGLFSMRSLFSVISR